MITIRKPNRNDNERRFYDMLQDIEEEHSYMHGAKDMPFEKFPMWLHRAEQLAELSTPYSFTTYWILQDDEPIGIGVFQHVLTDELRENGGNIAYCIAPQHRRKGYGSVAIPLLVEKMRESDINEILFMINKSNISSIRCAEKAGAKVFRENDIYYYLTIYVGLHE